MPIDLTRSSAEKSSSSSFATSNSLYSFHQQHKVGISSGGTSSSSHHQISSSKSSNCLSDTLIEDEALIEKLFPKCRPKSIKKSTTTTTSSSSARSSTERTNGGTAAAVASQRKSSIEMLSKADQGGQEGPPAPSSVQMPPAAAVRKGGAVRKSGFNACHPPTYHSNVPSRRLWNFMDISPSPSPPPLSPVEPLDGPGTVTRQQYEPHDKLPSETSQSPYTGERPSPVGEQYQSATSTTSGYDGSSSSSNCRDQFKSTKGGRFDINSLELNRMAPEKESTTFKGDHKYYGDAAMEKPSARSASQSHSKHTAHFRLDSLLLSPDEPQPYNAPNSKQQLSNGIKKSNRFTLDVDDEDDVLFSRFHHHSSNGQPRSAAAPSTATGPSKNFLKDSSNSYLIDSHRSSRERLAEAAAQLMPTTMSTGSRRETSVESTRNSRARAIREELVDACARELVSKLPPQPAPAPAATTASVSSSHCRMVKEDVGSISDNEEDNDDSGGFKSAGTATAAATATASISTGARNRIELAGGRELFSSSRSMRSKRRSSNHATTTSGHGQSAKTNAELQQQQQQQQHQSYQPPSQASSTVSSRRSGSGFISRHTQLYSVSMATEGGANEAAPTSQHSEHSNVAGESTAVAAAATVVANEELPSEGRLLPSETQTQQTQRSQQQTQLQLQQQSPQLVNTSESPVVTADKNLRSSAGAGACNTNDQRTPVESPPSTSTAAMSAAHCHRMPGEAAALVSELLETTPVLTNLEDRVDAVPLGDEEEMVSSSNQEEEQVDGDSEDSNSNSSCGTSAKSFEGAASSPSHEERIARIIGSVPIAQYEGSPKRYGPKPGYPKRVLSTSSNNSCSNEYEPPILTPNKKVDTSLPVDNDEEQDQHQLEDHDQLEQHKTKLVNLSLSENGSPHSSTHSSTSSATFSSTDIHSSSSFSCPSNANHHHQQHQLHQHHHPLPKLSSTSHHHHFGTSKWANEAVDSGSNNNIANNNSYDRRSNDEHCFSADNGGGNRNVDQSAIDTCDESCGVAVAPPTRKVVAESNFPATEEIVKTILSLPSGQIDTEDDVDEDVTESSSDKATAGEEMMPPTIGGIHSSNSRTATEPMYSSIASSGGYSAVDANKSSGYSSKRSLHSDDSESVTKSKTSISGSSGHGDRGSSLNRSSTSLKQQSLSEANRSIGSQSTLDGNSVKQLNSSVQLPSEAVSRNVPKSLRLERDGVVGSSYHHHSQTRYHLEPSQSFESTDSSYRSSEQCANSKDYYYGQSDDDLYLYGPTKTSSSCYPGKTIAGGPTGLTADRTITSSGNLNGGSSGLQEGQSKGAMMPAGQRSTQVPQLHLSYTALSPKLSTLGSGGSGESSKLYGVLDSTYESTGDYPSDNNTESYESETAGKSGGDGGVSGDGARIKVMPILEDGLSSGMPSSDELEYDEDEEGEDEMVAHEHDLDEYVNEYHSNNSRSNCESTSMMQPQPPPTTSTTGSYGNSTSSSHRLDQMVNGTSSGGSANYSYHSYGKQGPPSSSDYALPHKSSDGQVYRCQKGSYGLEMAEEMAGKTKETSHDFYNGHHHHSNHHLHNHPVLDELTPGAATRSISNSSSNNSSMSTVRNSQLGPSSAGGKQQQQHQQQQPSSSSPPPPAPTPGGGGGGGGSNHHHYHHYYHQSSAGAPSAGASLGRQNYPNLSSSPTSLSPNSPGGAVGSVSGGGGGLHHQQSSASSSSSSSHPSASQAAQQQQQQQSGGGGHHYHQTAGGSAVSTVSAAAGSSAAAGVQSPAEMASAVGTSTSPSSSHTATGGMLPPPNVRHHHDEDCDTDQETDRLLGSQRNDDRGFYDEKAQLKRSSTSREAFPPAVLIEGVLFRARYLGSTQLVCDGQPTKATRMMQAEEAVSRIKAPEGENQPSTEVDLFISTEKIMVLNTDLKEIMMDHALRTISYIADIGDLLVLMARRRTPIDDPNDTGIKRIPKMICHVFESEEAQYIAQSIGQAFQVAYMEFLKANGIEDSSFLKEMDYQEVLNSQEIFGNELEMFAKRERQKEVIVPKQKGEILGIVIVESGWGSMLPTVVIANMAQSSPSARCGQLNIGDQIIAINGISLVGLPLSTCQAYVKNTKNQTAVKFTIVPCAPVVEVKIKRPDTKYQLGFSVQNGVICSLLRGGIAERGGVRVGHRIIEINGQSVVAVPHDRIVNLLATSVGEIHMKTMPTSMFRLLTGQDSPSYM